MNTRRITRAIVAAAMLLPVAGHSLLYAADNDGDTDRSSPKLFAKDALITTKIKAAMAKQKGVSATSIKVDTDNAGVVQLSGTAKSQAEANKAVAIAKKVKGVTSVENHIQVSAGG
jgi:hyperosmotically inducible periplasmic protein